MNILKCPKWSHEEHGTYLEIALNNPTTITNTQDRHFNDINVWILQKKPLYKYFHHQTISIFVDDEVYFLLWLQDDRVMAFKNRNLFPFDEGWLKHQRGINLDLFKGLCLNVMEPSLDELPKNFISSLMKRVINFWKLINVFQTTTNIQNWL